MCCCKLWHMVCVRASFSTVPIQFAMFCGCLAAIYGVVMTGYFWQCLQSVVGISLQSGVCSYTRGYGCIFWIPRCTLECNAGLGMGLCAICGIDFLHMGIATFYHWYLSALLCHEIGCIILIFGWRLLHAARFLPKEIAAFYGYKVQTHGALWGLLPVFLLAIQPVFCYYYAICGIDWIHWHYGEYFAVYGDSLYSIGILASALLSMGLVAFHW